MTVLFINFKVIPRLSSVSLRSSSERAWLTNVKFPGPLPCIFWMATAKSCQDGEKTGHNTAICSGFILSSWYRLEATCVKSLEGGKSHTDRGQTTAWCSFTAKAFACSRAFREPKMHKVFLWLLKDHLWWVWFLKGKAGHAKQLFGFNQADGQVKQSHKVGDLELVMGDELVATEVP